MRLVEIIELYKERRNAAPIASDVFRENCFCFIGGKWLGSIAATRSWKLNNDLSGSEGLTRNVRGDCKIWKLETSRRVREWINKSLDEV